MSERTNPYKIVVPDSDEVKLTKAYTGLAAWATVCLASVLAIAAIAASAIEDSRAEYMAQCVALHPPAQCAEAWDKGEDER